ncbi:MAG: pseudouridine synthase, partial [Schleiferiaceae bacterium]
WNMEGLGPKHFSGEGRIHPKYGTDGRERKAGYANTGYRKQPTGRPKFKTAEEYAPDSDTMRLNRYLAHAGISSRREADELISQGLVTVNGQVVTEMGYKVQPGDDVRYAGERLKSERKVYVLLNKPKGFITTVDDERARKTVMDLVANACRERIYPVGRLDRATTGVLLLTNDGAMAKKLTHPSHGARKIYHVTLDKPFSPADADRLKRGIKLDDGPVQVDQVEIPDPENLYEVGVEIHVGRNRIVRRMFGALGYEVVKLDRTVFAGLTKKNLSRGQYRLLNEKEIAFLKIQQ